MSTIFENWRAGRGLPDLLVIDGHIHFAAGFCGPAFPSIAAAAAHGLQMMDANGVDAACIVGGGGYGPGNDYIAGNDDLLEFCAHAPDRYIGFAHLNPNDSEANIQAELDRVWRMGMRAFKLINSYQQNYPPDGPNLMRVYRFAADKNMLVLNHHWPSDVLDRLSREFPSVQFITGHFICDPVLERPNVYCNYWGLLPLGVLEQEVRRFGAQKYLYGSDAFLNPISVGIGLAVFADLPDDDKRLMLGINQARLLDAVGVLPQRLKRKLIAQT